MSATKIQYVVIRRDDVNDILSGNFSFEMVILNTLRYYPEDLLQFRQNFDYFDYVKEQNDMGVQILFLPIAQLLRKGRVERFKAILAHLKRICVLFVPWELRFKARDFLNALRIEMSLPIYYSIYNDEALVEVQGDSQNFIDHYGFYRLLHRDVKILSKHVSHNCKLPKKLQLKIPHDAHVVDHSFHFKPIVSNVINSLKADNISYISHHDKWATASDIDRQSMLLGSLEELDDIHLEWGMENHLSSRWSLPTLILIFPFHNPVLRKVLERSQNNPIKNILLAEQRDDYIFTLDNEEGLDEEQFKKLSGKILKSQYDILDGIGYLHSTFQFSPVLRFPIRSSILNRMLSMFSLGKRTGILTSHSRYKSILKFGKKLNETFLSRELEDYLSNRDGQILVISDLPIEWMTIKGIPLNFLCDVCRLQDSNIQGLINNYSAFSKFRFKLGSNSVKRTLVIFSGSEQDKTFFNESIKMAQLYREEQGFIIGFASSGQEVSDLLDCHKPVILIFDCHCVFELETLSCYLKLGDTRLYAEDIIVSELYAPVVFLACCNSNPNYDNVNKLHDAFFQVGALSVTGTFLPIDMNKGTFIYLRMLTLLNSANERKASGNWLHFVSFAIRTSVIWEARFKCYKKLKRELTDDEEKVFIELLEKLHRFEDRNEVFHQLLNNGVKLSPEMKLFVKDTNLEFSYYTHYGRPDLIGFRD
ncbi:MAG: hypothetical protein JWN56_3056 [Sphingobacteriales bacterium]|nr:hypothetical protein [Sphingobacteriales bacterium]